MSLSIDNITVRYDSNVAVASLTLDVATGERFAVMGPSGSGKSTLLRSIAGLTAIDAGTIAIDGEDMTRIPAHRRPVGLMFQDYALFPHMTVAQNVAYGLRMAGMASTERSTRSFDLLGLVGLDGFADRMPTTLSGGEQQRVALARTLAPEPSVVLLDEPLGSLDISLRESLLAETRSILDSVGATSIYVTHDRTEAFAFCDRMAIMRDGEILRIGTPAEIWHAPGSGFVSAAIGQSSLVEMAVIAPGRPGLGFVPLDACRMHDRGRLTGIISASRFRDGADIASVMSVDGTSTFDIRTPHAMAIGSPVRFDVDLDQVIEVSADEV